MSGRLWDLARSNNYIRVLENHESNTKNWLLVFQVCRKSVTPRKRVAALVFHLVFRLVCFGFVGVTVGQSTRAAGGLWHDPIRPVL